MIRALVDRLKSAFSSAPDPLVAQSIAIQRNALMREAEKDDTIRALASRLNAASVAEEMRAMMQIDRESEMVEALYMGGSGPWRMPHAETIRQASKSAKLREGESLSEFDTALILSEAPAFPYIAQGAYGDAELMLNNIEWKREVNLSWLEFTRWGIQQIILIARLRCLRDPMLRRGMNTSAQYVFGRGVQITSPDQATNDLLKDWRERNKKVLGQVGLTDLERAKFYDGNLFFACFADAKNTGDVNIRTIDATEIMDQMTDPDDSAMPWYYKRCWTQGKVNAETGVVSNERTERWHPALNFEPKKGEEGYFDEIQGIPVDWDAPIYHRKCAVPQKWHFGLPEVYPALQWGDAVKRFLQDCMTIRNALAQFSMILTTKGGQQALQGAKSQMSTTVGPNASLWDQNPPAVAGAIFASGPGSTLTAFNSKGAGGDPDDVRQIKLMVCMTFGLPESFFSDMNTSNLATATSLDRPTELNFMERQEVWVEDLTTLAMYQIRKAKGAVNSAYRESLKKERGVDDKALGNLRVIEMPRTKDQTGRWVYEAAKPKAEEITVMVEFPAIIEADVPGRIASVVNAMTLGSKMGTVTGIDEKAGVTLLGKELGLPDLEELIEKMYPNSYDPDRTKQPEPAPGIDPEEPEGQMQQAREAVLQAFARVAHFVSEAKAKKAA